MTEKTKAIKPPTPKIEPKTFRQKAGMNQTDFYGPMGVTQSAGSRYESGRRIPKPTHHLMELLHGTNPVKYLAALRGMTVEDFMEKFSK